MYSICAIFIFSSFLGGLLGLPINQFYAFGSIHGDSRLPNVDDGSSGQIHLGTPFSFFGNHHTSLYVNTNGDISFLAPFTGYTPNPFPYQQNVQLIAPFWADIDTRKGGDVWYRETRDVLSLRQATQDVRNFFPEQANFNATWLFVVTWDNVAFYGADSSGRHKRNTFQCVLVTDGRSSFVIFHYNKIQWTTGTANDGDSSSGLGGTPAQVGFDAGDGTNYYAVSGSRTQQVLNLPRMSNVNVPGKFIFRIDLTSILIATSVDECVGKVCQHNGTCQDLDGINRWRCNCFPGYTGIYCETEIDECDSSPCVHGGDCVDLLDAYKCHCQAGFVGDNCQIDINECISNPCLHGATCQDLTNHYQCLCANGYTGNRCQIDINECLSSPCTNNGTCVDGVDEWDCACLPGYTGLFCETEINECSSQPCQNNGTCIDLVDGYMCICTNESSGVNCEKYLDHCLSTPCLHGGECSNTYGGYTCDCVNQWHGDNCEYQTINRTNVCTDLEYTECSCYMHRLPQPKSRSKILPGAFGYLIGLAIPIIFYAIYCCLHTSQNSINPNVLKPEHTIQSNTQPLKENINISPKLKDAKPFQKEHHNCFIDHNGFDFSKVFVNKDGTFRQPKCRHTRMLNEGNSLQDKKY